MATPTSTKPKRHMLPGFGLPLNFTPQDKHLVRQQGGSEVHSVRKRGLLFPNAVEANLSRRLITLREFAMMRFMNSVTDKSEWDTKIFDNAIVARWKCEALTQVPGSGMTELMFSYCIDELRFKSKRFRETGMVTAFDGDVVKSDVAIPAPLKDALRAAVAPLEDIPELCRDWHPGSNETVLDLVHPSLFPVVYGRTRILANSIVGLDDCTTRCGEGEILSVPPQGEARGIQTDIPWYRHQYLFDPFSRKFQWLPCEVGFDGDKTKITSYINNLHPQIHKPLYEVIEQIIELTIPLWNQTLTPFRTFQSPERITYTQCIYDPDPERLPEHLHPQKGPQESDNDYWSRLEQWFADNRRVVLPEPGTFTAPEQMEIFDLKKKFASRGLQIIVKLANIHLTPKNPKYEGGTWHVEGQLNEHICATALFYYDSLNITESHLSFRQQSSPEDAEEVDYVQEHHDWLEEVFGCEQYGSIVQFIGDVVTKEGRLLTFPNVFQHRVSPFSLADETKPGHRKILALFLVDPHIKIISSAHVPCQQKEWWMQELHASAAFPMFPVEILKEVVDKVEEFPIGLDEAKRLRLELMDERKVFVKKHDDQFNFVTFSLCEH